MNYFKSYELKIKALSLALEGALIHRNEGHLKDQIHRCKGDIWIAGPMRGHWKKAKIATTEDTARITACRETLLRLRTDRDSLRGHRKTVVRGYARDAHLAYGFLRGCKYLEIEAKRYTDPNWSSIWTMIEKYGARAGTIAERKEAFAQWKKEAGACAQLSNAGVRRPRVENKTLTTAAA